jgi:acyl carrier protein
VVTDIAAEVRDILVFHLGSEEATLTDNAKLIEDLGADSLDVVEVVMSCEERFDIDIPNHVATKLVTVGDAIAFIRAHIAGNHPSRWPGAGAPRPDVQATS